MNDMNNPKVRGKGTNPNPLPRDWVTVEPPHGSVVLTESMTGTAWQRHFSDGLWHSTTGRKLPWDQVGTTNGNPKFRTLIYRAPEDA